ncbi:flagellin, partial [Paracoccaceae bacterium]|nr:flagellin [Paracoccaceae bacterium]
MSLSIGTNNSAMRASQAASIAARGMEASMERLSTGKRINSASDDAAGVAISSRLSAEVRGTNQSVRNALDAQALLDTAEGSHKEIENVLQRMREIAVQSANDTNNSQDRLNLQTEMNAMTKEIDRISHATTWAGTALLDGAAGVVDTNAAFSFQVGSATGTQNQISINIGSTTAESLGLTHTDGNSLAIVIADATATADGRTAAEHVTGNAATTANGNAMVTIGLIDAAIKEVNAQRSTLGATTNRLNHTVNNLTNMS